MITIPLTLETKQQLSLKPRRPLRLEKPQKNDNFKKKDCQKFFKKMLKFVKG